MAVLWLVWLVPQPTCCFFQSQMSIFGSLASKKKMVGEPYYIANILSLDTWKREQGLSMFDKRRSTPVGTHLFFERRREKLRQPKKKLAKSWRWFYLTSNICSRGQADPKLSAPSPTRKEVSLITKHFFRRKHQHPSQSRWTSSPRSNQWCGLAGKSFFQWVEEPVSKSFVPFKVKWSFALNLKRSNFKILKVGWWLTTFPVYDYLQLIPFCLYFHYKDAGVPLVFFSFLGIAH